MRYALILAGGSGTRLWPMSRNRLPKQLLPFMDGRSLLSIAYERLEGLVPATNRYVCAGKAHRDLVLAGLPGLAPERFIGEPEGRDTLNALGFCMAILRKIDPGAVVAVFTSDHLITPEEDFRATIRRGYETVEARPETLVTFGIAPTRPATGFGYLELTEPYGEAARRVARFVEKPDLAVATGYLMAGQDRYLWNSGMFVWRASTFLDCVRRFAPEAAPVYDRIAADWGTPRFADTAAREFPALKKISVDYAIMQPASTSGDIPVAAVPMKLDWLDVGSWPAYAETRAADSDGNARSAVRALVRDSKNTLVVSDDPAHLVALLGCEDLIVVHTKEATLVCDKAHAEEIKKLRADAEAQFGTDYI